VIPENVAEFVQGPIFLSIGARDETLRPAHAWAVGAVVAPDRETVTCFVVEERARKILPHLDANGPVAMGAGSPTHEAYQLKGRYLSSRPADEQERAFLKARRNGWLALALRCGYPEQIARPLILGFRHQPAVAITFRVEEVFLQTPGPDAGKKIG